MLVYLMLLDDCVIVTARPTGSGVVGEVAHEMQVVGPNETFHAVAYEELRQLGEGEHEIVVA